MTLLAMSMVMHRIRQGEWLRWMNFRKRSKEISCNIYAVVINLPDGFVIKTNVEIVPMMCKAVGNSVKSLTVQLRKTNVQWTRHDTQLSW